MEKGNSYRDLKVWQRAMDLVEDAYRVSSSFPQHELYGLTSQLRRAAVSIPANIAEGQARRHKNEFVQHLWIARGSLMETETHLIIAERLKYAQPASIRDLLSQTDEVSRMLSGLISSLKLSRE